MLSYQFHDHREAHHGAQFPVQIKYLQYIAARGKNNFFHIVKKGARGSEKFECSPFWWFFYIRIKFHVISCFIILSWETKNVAIFSRLASSSFRCWGSVMGNKANASRFEKSVYPLGGRRVINCEIFVKCILGM